MNKHAIYHRAKSNYAYCYDFDTMHIRLRSAKDDLVSVDLLCQDPYDWAKHETKDMWVWNLQPHKMTLEHSTDLFDYWYIEFKPPFHRLKYGFALNDGHETILFNERGFFDIDNYYIRNDVNSFFAFPYMNKIDVFKAPNWVKETIWYQIFPERFANGDESNDPEGALPWASTDPTRDNFFGGDLQGVIDNFDHILDLGVNGIYFTPIFISPSNHKYDTIDYFEIDPSFGDKELFRKLVELAHKNGIKIMLDAVFNHMGYYSKQWQDVLENGENSKYKDWFYIKDFDFSDLDENKLKKELPFETFGFTEQMPKLNTENEEVKAYLIEIGLYWVREFNIDAWRLDVANEVDHQFWREFRQALKKEKEDIFIIGETWHDSYPWLLGDQFDSVMNYPLTKGIVEYTATNHIKANGFKTTVVDGLLRYGQHINEVMFNLIDSHDTPRLLSIADGNVLKAKLAYVMQLSFPGSPCIYYGGEVGLDGGYDPLCRKCMIWDKEKQDLDLYEHVKKLINIRKIYSNIITTGRISFIEADDFTNVVIYKSYNNNDSIFYLINCSDVSVNVETPSELKGTIKDIYNDTDFNIDNRIEIEPYGFYILKKHD